MLTLFSLQISAKENEIKMFRTYAELEQAAKEKALHPDYSCLSRASIDNINIQFQENKDCHESLQLLNEQELPIKNLMIAFLIGAILGVGTTMAVHK
jgi:hypothetical protein